jgi:hypothetical protein
LVKNIVATVFSKFVKQYCTLNNSKEIIYLFIQSILSLPIFKNTIVGKRVNKEYLTKIVKGNSFLGTLKVYKHLNIIQTVATKCFSKIDW